MGNITYPVILAALVLLIASPCMALRMVSFVDRERARKLGIDVRATANGPEQAWVEMEFKPAGELKDFLHVSLEIRDGKKFLMGWAPLESKRTDAGAVKVGFLADRKFLQNVTLSIVTGHPTNTTGHEVRLKDFIDFERL